MKQNPTISWMTAHGLMILPAVSCSAPIVGPIRKAIDEGTLIHEGEYSILRDQAEEMQNHRVTTSKQV